MKISKASKNSFLDHIKYFRKAVTAIQAECIISADTWQAFVRKGDQHYVFYPQFQANIEGQLLYQNTLTDHATMFAGWLPYQLKRWDIASNKLAFKRFAEANEVPSPRYWVDNVPTEVPVIIKSAQSSFGQQILGPFRSMEECALDVSKGQYYEQYIEGSLLKLWFWNETPICCELDKLPTVTGDGVSTIEQLVVNRRLRNGAVNAKEMTAMLKRTEQLLKFYQTDLSTTLPSLAKHLVEFRYGSMLMLSDDRQVIQLAVAEKPAWYDQLSNLESIFNSQIPENIRANTLSTIDCIVTTENKIYVLEVNCNPTVHPLCYTVMLNTI